MEDRVNKEMNPMKVAVIGGGLVGALAAVFLARRGHLVDLYEYREDIRRSPQSRGRTINLSLSARGRVALSKVGLEEKALELGLPLQGRMIHRSGNTPLPALYDPKSKKCIYSVNRKHLNELLLTEAEKYPNVNLHFNQKVVEANLESGSFVAQNTSTKETADHQVDLILGADGAFSAIRRSMTKRERFNFSQEYIQHGYLELSIPPIHGSAAMDSKYLHLWPRGNSMMVAMPNQDQSFTVTLFMPHDVYDEITSTEAFLHFFNKYFKDAFQLMGKEQLVSDWFRSKLSPLVSIKCKPYHVADKAVIIGDAAHAMVPFYGQGMNAGFEDCFLLDDLLDRYTPSVALQLFSEMRCQDAHAICDLAMYNFSEIGCLVIRPSFQWRRRIDNTLHLLFGSRWIPLYQAVSFTCKPYTECWSDKRKQDMILRAVFAFISIVFFLIIGVIIKDLV